MILIADSGTTKTDWRAIEACGCITSISTEGINPVFQTPEKLDEIFKKALIPQLEGGEVTKIFFYSAGVAASNEATEALMKVFSKNFYNCDFFVETDKLGSARALCGRNAGIACIMGTGSNSCFYDGEKITDNNVGGGFILGDEGGGASLGKRLLSDFIRGLLPEEVAEALRTRYNLDYITIVDNVYKRPMPNRWLASFSPFIEEFIGLDHIRDMVDSQFDSFIKRNLYRYDTSNYAMNAVGSVAYFFKDNLERVAKNNGIKVGEILKNPIEKLVQYHSADL